MSAPVSLSVENLALVRGNRLVFRDLNFAACSGETLAIEGANGAGKTSLLRALAGFLTPASGTIALKSGDILIDDAEDRGKFVGWLGHFDGVKSALSPRETLRFFAKFYGSGEAIEAVLELAGLAGIADLPAQYLSAGQRKRLALARLKLSDRPVWLLDEPLAALDAAGKILVAELIKSHCASGGLAVVATHEALGLDSARLVLT